MRGFTPRQRLILALLTTAVVVVFSLLGYSVFTTLRSVRVPSPLPTPAEPELSSPVPSTTPQITAAPSHMASPSPTRPVPLSQIQNARAVREVGRIVASLRGLPSVEQFPVSFPTEREIAPTCSSSTTRTNPRKTCALLQPAGAGAPSGSAPASQRDGPGCGDLQPVYLPEGRPNSAGRRKAPATPDVSELALAHTLARCTLQDTAFPGPAAAAGRVPPRAGLRPVGPTPDAAPRPPGAGGRGSPS